MTNIAVIGRSEKWDVRSWNFEVGSFENLIVGAVF